MHRTLRTVTTALLGLFLLTGSLAWTQDAPEPDTEEGPELGFGFGLGLGARSFEEDGSTEVYQYASLYPTMSYGKLSAGLDLTLHYTFTGGDGDDFEVREEDWVPSDDRNLAEIYLAKLRFVQWAEQGDPLYARVGSLDGVTLGNGFIVGGYRNTQFLPNRRIVGARLDLDGTRVGFPYLGLESMAANLATFDLAAARLYVRPLAGTDLTVLSGLEVGSTVAADLAPDYYTDKLDEERRRGAALAFPDPDEVLMWGADLRLPVLTEPPFTMTVFTDYARQEEAQGGMMGVGGRIVRVITYDGRMRLNGENFLPVYFDAPYDLYRLQKYGVYQSEQTLIEAHTGWAATGGLSLFEDLLVLQVGAEGPFGSVEGAQNQLTGLFRLERGLLPSLSFEARYRELDIDSVEDLVDPDNSVIDARITYHAEPAAISLVYNLRYDPSTDEYVIASGIESEITLR